jgi:hypothetical protein
MVRAVRGDTRDRSAYLRALSAVIVVMAFMKELVISIIINSQCIAQKSMRYTNGRSIINEKRRVPQAREYSSNASFFLISVKLFPASSHRDLRNATTRARIIPIIISQ